METNIDSIKRELQEFFTDGLVVVVGSGLSIAEGIPGMSHLANHLGTNLPEELAQSEIQGWNNIWKQIENGAGLESALFAYPPSIALQEAIVKMVANYIEEAESKVLCQVIKGERVLAFSKLLPHLNPQPNKALPIITTNYERLIEFSAESIGWGVDSMFLGQHIGILNQAGSANSFIKSFQLRSRHLTIQQRNRIALYKPHGSLDWYSHPSGPLRTSVDVDLPRLIIAPGSEKYRKGYGIPFDKHRDAGNDAIDKAARILVIGYGFNDDHLETHLSQHLRMGKPCLVLTHSLTENGQKVLEDSPNMTVICSPSGGLEGFTCIRSKSRAEYEYSPIWQVSKFTEEILNP